jgi:hypothetical protein
MVFRGNGDPSQLGLDKVLPNYAIWHFKMQIGESAIGQSFEDQAAAWGVGEPWGGISLRSSSITGDVWNYKNVLYGFKWVQFELQKFQTTNDFGRNLDKTNLGDFRLGCLHDIKIGALDIPEGGVHMVLWVDDKLIYDYYDYDTYNEAGTAVNLCINDPGKLLFSWYNILGRMTMYLYPASYGEGEEADKALLGELVAKAETIVPEAFTSATAAALKSALASAKAALANKGATQAAVDEARADVAAAIGGLVVDIANPAVAPAAELLSMMLSILEVNASDYAPEPWANLMSVMDDAWDLIRLLLGSP